MNPINLVYLLIQRDPIVISNNNPKYVKAYINLLGDISFLASTNNNLRLKFGKKLKK